jgi:ribosome maturation factor RimP
MASLVDELIALLEPLAGAHGLDLVTVEVVGGHKHQTVRVFLDREGGIDIDAITEANDWLSEALDGVSRLNGPYTLEVSSPGIERVLRKRADFTRFVGQRVSVQLTQAVDGRSKLTGHLVGLDGDTVVLDADGK